LVCDRGRHPPPVAGVVCRTGRGRGARGRAVVTVRTHAIGLIVVLAGLLVSSCAPEAPPPPGAGATAVATQSVSTGQVTVTFASEPDPPRAGDNGVVVTVKQPDGTPVTDGSVTAVFSMPAMPSMNMPAMGSDATPDHQGG